MEVGATKGLNHLTKQKLLAKIQNNTTSIRYNDFVALIKAYGFKRTHSNGSHEIYRRQDIPDIVNIQNDNGKAKSYQVKQFLSIIEKYNLKLEDDSHV